MNEIDLPTTPRTDKHSPDEMRQATLALARWFSVPALALLLMGPVLLAWMWLVAWNEGRFPIEPESWGGNHGPWRHAYQLRAISDYALGLPLLAAPLALLSLCARRTGLAVGILVLVPVYEVLAFAGLLPLFD
jgi:hypothetical protein